MRHIQNKEQNGRHKSSCINNNINVNNGTTQAKSWIEKYQIKKKQQQDPTYTFIGDMCYIQRYK